MTKLTDILDLAFLWSEVQDGYVTERRHPEFGELAIYNYSPKCQYENRWNDVTTLTRGLIANMESGEVIARGFPKFFNYGDEANTGQLDLNMPIMGAFDKMDGSLGIQYVLPNGRQAIATRGSFVSEQALHATGWLRQNELDIMPDGEYSWLWEIIYPGNRIVVDYGQRDELVYLGAAMLEDGGYFPFEHRSTWQEFSAASRFPALTLGEALSLPPRDNAEGLVVWFDSYRAVKLKQDDYVALHRIVTNLSEKEVWRQLRAGTFEEFAAALPDEFHQWVKDTATPLMEECLSTLGKARTLLIQLEGLGLPDRKSEAIWITTNAPVEYRGFLFGLLDGKDISDGIWKLIEPKGDEPRAAGE